MSHPLPATTSAAQRWLTALPLAADWCTAVLLTGITGVLIAQGHDGLAYTLGILAAGFIWAALVVPALPQVPSAVSLPGFLALRCNSPAVGTVAAALMMIALAGNLASEIIALETILRQFAPNPRAIAVAIGAAGIGCMMAVRPTAQPATALAYALAPVFFAVVAIAILYLAPPGSPGAFVSIPALGDVAALEQGLLERRLADPATFKPHAVPFLRTSATNFACLIVLLGFGLAMLARVRLASQPTHSGALRERAARVVMIITAIVISLPALAAAAKRVLLTFVNNGVRPSALPEWLASDLVLGNAQLCGIASSDPAALAKACGKGVGPQGVIRWGDLVIAPDQMLYAAFDAGLTAPNPAKIALALAVVVAAIWTARRVAQMAYEASPAVSASVSPVAMLSIMALSGAMIALAHPADALTLMTWSASLAASTLAPVLLACVMTSRPSSAASIAAMLVGTVLTSGLILAARYAPVDLLQMTNVLQAAPSAVTRKLATLQDAWAAAADGPGRDALRAQAERLAFENLNWWGIKPVAAGIFGATVAALLALTGSAISSARRRR